MHCAPLHLFPALTPFLSLQNRDKDGTNFTSFVAEEPPTASSTAAISLDAPPSQPPPRVTDVAEDEDEDEDDALDSYAGYQSAQSQQALAYAQPAAPDQPDAQDEADEETDEFADEEEAKTYNINVDVAGGSGARGGGKLRKLIGWGRGGKKGGSAAPPPSAATAQDSEPRRRSSFGKIFKRGSASSAEAAVSMAAPEYDVPSADPPPVRMLAKSSERKASFDMRQGEFEQTLAMHPDVPLVVRACIEYLSQPRLGSWC